MDKKAKDPLISICVPSYNRAQFLRPLIDSILFQNFADYEILICEDNSPERESIVSIVEEYKKNGCESIRLILNGENLGYDGNIRKLAREAAGNYLFYLGNDDLLNEGALNALAEAINHHSEATIFLRSYAWFNNDPRIWDEEIYYFSSDRLLSGQEALRVAFRRAGVISGFIIKRDIALECETDKYDGTLYYQMHLAINAVKSGSLYYIHNILTLSRSSTTPDFGNSITERGVYTPGRYTTTARLSMFSGAIKILKDQCSDDEVDIVLRDYANHFYPYIKDQLNLNTSEFYKYYKSLGRIGFSKYFMFHLYCLVCFLFGEKKFDLILKRARKIRRYIY